jgi:hypothetical protein
MTFIAKI